MGYGATFRLDLSVLRPVGSGPIDPAELDPQTVASLGNALIELTSGLGAVEDERQVHPALIGGGSWHSSDNMLISWLPTGIVTARHPSLDQLQAAAQRNPTLTLPLNGRRTAAVVQLAQSGRQAEAEQILREGGDAQIVYGWVYHDASVHLYDPLQIGAALLKVTGERHGSTSIGSHANALNVAALAASDEPVSLLWWGNALFDPGWLLTEQDLLDRCLGARQR